MKIKNSELKGPALDWAVAHCEGYRGVESLTKPDPLDDGALEHRWLREYSPSTDWTHGGPIIERERIEITFSSGQWQAGIHPELHNLTDGPTPLIAEPGCDVAPHRGDQGSGA